MNLEANPLVDVIEAIISERPSSMRELVDSTGVPSAHIVRVLLHLQRDQKKRLVNVGSRSLAVWYLEP